VPSAEWNSSQPSHLNDLRLFCEGEGDLGPLASLALVWSGAQRLGGPFRLILG
jgi:hypothetical protein